MAKSPDKPKKPKDPARPTRAKAARPDAPATPDTLAELLNPGIARGTAGLGSGTGIQPPAMSGDPRLERALRVQGNTLESVIVLLPALWLAALYFQGWAPPILGAIWCLGRIFYAMGYMRDASRRHVGFAISIFMVLILVILAAIGLVQAWTASV